MRIKTINNPIYNEIGVTPVINASGTKTTHGGTQLDKSVIDAMKMASQNFVSVDELNKSIGNYISQITGSEAGMVTSGAASGVVLSIAACMTGTDDALIRMLPDSSKCKNEVILQKIHVGAYAHMYSFAGASIVEIGHMGGCAISDLENAITSKTAAIAYLFGPRISQNGLTLEEVVGIGKKYAIPVIVDAAAMLPPKANLSLYIKKGADLVTISGGKFIKGPQNSGILYGKKHLVDAAIMNSSPNHSIGRPHKISKENMVGLYTALKNYMELDEESILKKYHDNLLKIKPIFDNIKNIKADIIHDWKNYNVPVLAISCFNDRIDLKKIPSEMLESKPRVFMQYFAELGHLVINPISLSINEMNTVASKLSRILKSKNYEKLKET